MPKSIKILLLSYSDSNGGASIAAYRFFKSLKHYGLNVKMFVKDKKHLDESILPLSFFISSNFFMRIMAWFLKKIKNKYYHYIWSKYPLKQNVFLSDLRSEPINGALQEIDFDILHLNWFNQRFFDIKELLKINKPIVWTLHDFWAFTGICHYPFECNKFQERCGYCEFLNSNKEKDLSSIIWKQKYEVYSKLKLHIVTPTSWLAEEAKKSSLMKNFNIQVIPNTLDISLFSPTKKEIAFDFYNIKRDSINNKYILFGSINPNGDRRKGLSELLEALKILEIDNNINFEFIVFGSDKNVQVSLNIPIHYLGFIDNDEDLVKAYSLADVMVVPSLSEVFGQTASESMACGTPVVAFNCSGIKEVVDHKVNGYLAEPYSAEDLAHGIRWCIENNKNGDLSLNARNKVLQNYSYEVVAEKYVQLYKSILK